ncbi:MAG: flagellar basal-body rod protein FlgG [Candidatus Saganbacteria bacterium]|nr:flagellar basal-body rod protein FlgG [Candidatus Saganbacteria bacterium]
MFEPLYVASSGLEALEQEISNITNNLANASTVGFKKSRTEMESLYYVQRDFSEELERAVRRREGVLKEFTLPIEMGTGVRVAATTKDFTQGTIEVTNRPFDLSIQGDGFFQYQMQDGTVAYGRAGNLHVDNDGNLVDSNGHFIEPRLTIPPEATQVSIRSDGTVLVKINNELESSEIGQINIARFSNSNGLKSLGQNLFASTDSSGDPIIGNPGDDGYGTITQYSLENSNVDVITEMMQMVMVQRVFDTIAKAVQSYDAMLTAIGNMKQA